MILDGPSLDRAKINREGLADDAPYPFSLPILRGLEEIVFPTQVTFFVGENGTGKSTILEAIARRAGFGPEGGSRNISFNTTEEAQATSVDPLSARITLSWRKKPRDGYFFRAESFFALANHIDYIAREGGQGRDVAYASYGGKSLHQQSHGESFFAFFGNRVGGGFYVFDEPEAALSPKRQLALMRVIRDRCKNPEAQFVIATHSPILLSYPGATIYSCDGDALRQVRAEETEHYRVTREFLENPERYFRQLFSD